MGPEGQREVDPAIPEVDVAQTVSDASSRVDVDTAGLQALRHLAQVPNVPRASAPGP